MKGESYGKQGGFGNGGYCTGGYEDNAGKGGGDAGYGGRGDLGGGAYGDGGYGFGGGGYGGGGCHGGGGGFGASDGYGGGPVGWRGDHGQGGPYAGAKGSKGGKGKGAKANWVPEDAPPTTLWVGGVPAGGTLADVLAAFSVYGAILNATLGGKPAASGDLSAFVRFGTRSEAERAMAAAAAHSIAFPGGSGSAEGEHRDVKCQWSRHNCFAHGVDTNICIRGLTPGIQAKDVAMEFDAFGDVLSAAVAVDGRTAAICFKSLEEAEAALTGIERGRVSPAFGTHLMGWLPSQGPVWRGYPGRQDAAAGPAAYELYGEGGGYHDKGGWQPSPSGGSYGGCAYGGDGGGYKGGYKGDYGGDRYGGPYGGKGGPYYGDTGKAAKGSKGGYHEGKGWADSRPSKGAKGGAHHGEEIHTLWVGGVHSKGTMADLLVGFHQFGSLLCATFAGRPAASGDLCGFIRFGSAKEAEAALDAARAGRVTLPGSEQRTLVCQWSRVNSEINFAMDSNLCLSGIPSGTTSGDIAEAFASIGAVMSASASEAGELGAVCFSSAKESEEAIKRSASGTLMVRGTPVKAWRPNDYTRADGSSGTGALATLWVGGVPAGSSGTDLVAVFCPFGGVVTACIAGRPAASGDLSGFVRFTERGGAEAALDACSKKELIFPGGDTSRDVRCQWARSNSPDDPSAMHVCVSKLPQGTTAASLRSSMARHGDIRALSFVEVTSIGVITFSQAQEAEACLNAIRGGSHGELGAWLASHGRDAAHP